VGQVKGNQAKHLCVGRWVLRLNFISVLYFRFPFSLRLANLCENHFFMYWFSQFHLIYMYHIFTTVFMLMIMNMLIYEHGEPRWIKSTKENS
jgi:hypothetical protein